MLEQIHVLLVLIVVLNGGTNAARILMILPMDVPSQFFLGDRLLRELAARGHEVTMISPFKTNATLKNYRKIDLTSITEVMAKLFPNENQVNFISYGHLPVWKHIYSAYQTAWQITEVALTQPAMQNILNDPNEHFDLVMFNMIFSEALYGLAHKYDAPVVMLCTHVSSMWSNHLVANPAPSSYVPDFFIGYTGKMTLTERMYNTIHNLVTEAYRRYVYFPQIDASLHTVFPDAPPLFDIMYNRTALVLINSHPSISDPVPHVPAMVEVGGFHVEDPKPLSKELQEYMDNAPYGVILFSLGSNLKSVNLDESRRNQLLRAFSRLKQKVIWKWEDENLPGKPDNVKILKWCPQNDILVHPNLKLLITHGGMSSLTEAVKYGIPIVGIPVCIDQKMNIATIAAKGYGLGISYLELTEESLYTAVQEVLSNPKYRNAVKLGSQIFNSRPVPPLDSALFWIEHVIEHRGARHLRSAALELEWYQLYSIDIIFIFFILLLLLGYTTSRIIKYCGNYLIIYFTNIEKKKV